MTDVLIHTCSPRTQNRRFDDLNPDRWYYTSDYKYLEFKTLPLKCTCKRRVSYLEAMTLTGRREALFVYKPRDYKFTTSIIKDRIDLWIKAAPSIMQDWIDCDQIVMLIDRAQTPRVDLTSKADMERAYVDAREDYKLHIEEIHKMILDERAKLIVPFREDPDSLYDEEGKLFAGRLLFPFGPDQRTGGGH